MEYLFPFSQYWWFYLAFVGLVLALLALDLGVFHRHAHKVKFKEAATWTVVWISLALIFNFCLYLYSKTLFPDAVAKQVALEFLTGYVVEKSLAVDNIFIFIVVFKYFHVPQAYQHRVLFFGILGALVFRAAFVAVGAVLMQYHWVVIGFGAFLIFTGFKMFFTSEKPIAPDKNPAIKLFKRILPVTKDFEGQKMFVRKNGKLYATPLLVTLVFMEITDIVFAVDSVPAIFALTKEPLIVFTSNIFAILGLRAMFFMLAGSLDKFHLLKYGLASVLIFVGLKMTWLNNAFDGKFPITISLGIIATLIGGSIVASLFTAKNVDRLTD